MDAVKGDAVHVAQGDVLDRMSVDAGEDHAIVRIGVPGVDVADEYTPYLSDLPSLRAAHAAAEAYEDRRIDAVAHGVAIISHGFNGSHNSGRNYFKTLNDLGYAVYTFDFPCGSVNSLTDNDTMNMSITDEKEALKTIVKYFQKQKGIDRSRIVLIGESQGGLISALAAADIKKQISNLILIYPALCIPDDWNKRYPRVEDIPEVSEIWDVKLGRKFMMDVHFMDPYKIIGDYKGKSSHCPWN